VPNGTRIRTLALVLAVILMALPAAARADGDPASDVLASESLFLPQDAGVSARQYAQLGAWITAASRGGYPIRVAVVASPADLGSVTALWSQPQNYARFLGQELSLVYHGPLLVVMPAGYGFVRVGAPTAATPSALAGLGPPGTGLGPAAIAAVRRLAGASGPPLAISAAQPSASPRPADPVAWIVFAIGGVLMVLAWAASFRARPPRLASRPHPEA
jgi:hypothetical protein